MGDFDFKVTGLRRRPLKDLYYLLLSRPWGWLMTAAFVTYMLANATFASLYWIGGNSVSGGDPWSFRDAFFMSVQTFSTVGYGVLSPGTLYAEMLATAESFFGLMFMAVATGVVYAKFSRPSARVTFSNVAVTHDRRGRKVLQFRVVNQRRNNIFAVAMEVYAMIDETMIDGSRVQRVHKLALERESMPVFTVAWTVLHVIDQTSPLYGINFDGEHGLALVTVSFSGTDETFSQFVQARFLYTPEDFRHGHKFVDMIEGDENGRLVVHHERLHDTVPAQEE